MNFEDEGTQRWVPDDSFSLFCDGEDTTAYFDSTSSFGGYYVERRVPAKLPPHISYRGPLFVKVASYDIPQDKQDNHLFLFRGNGKWIIGYQYGLEHGVAYVNDGAATPFQMRHDSWMFARDDEIKEGSEDKTPWREEFARVYSSRTEVGWGASNVFAYADTSLFIRALRSIKHVPDGQLFRQLRNSVPMPLLGLGTGGLRADEMPQTIANALHLGYRTLDLAREYKNEGIVANVLSDRPDAIQSDFDKIKPSPHLLGIPTRSDVFIISKVWPTDLGFWPTADALVTSLRELKTNYIDGYLLHWPTCDATVSWMHCETSINPNFNWQQSWKALERAYAEGRVQSIGVSNFNVEQLNELLSFAAVKPHIVQNYASLGADEVEGVTLDLEVRQWCDEHNVVYIPYATNRNLKNKGLVTSPPRAAVARAKGVHGALDVASYTHKKSRHSTVLRFFLQTGAAIIPRASSVKHLVENLDVPSWQLTDSEMEKLGWIQTQTEVTPEL